MKFFLAVPMPAFAAAAFPQLPPEMLNGAPAWVLALAVVGWVVVSVLNMLGRLPYKASNGDARHGFAPTDRRIAAAVHADLQAVREATQKTYDLIAWKDDDGVPRFIRHVMEAHRAVERQSEYVESLKSLNHQAKVTNHRLEVIERKIGIEGQGAA